MKKYISIFLLVFIITGIVGCGQKSKNEAKEEPVKANKTTENSKSKETDKEDIKEIKLNEPFHVSTEWGDYEIIINELKKTDWWRKENDNDNKQVVVLNYEVNNISFHNENYNGVYLDASAFKVIDSKGYLNTDIFSVYEGEYPSLVPTGVKHKSSVAFAVDTDITYLDFILTRNNGNEDLGKIRFQL